MDCDNEKLPLEQSPCSPITNDEVSAVLADLSEEKQTQIIGLLIRRQTFQGPIPRPEHFAQYEQTLPGAADRILTMAEKEQEHRHREEDNNYTLDGRKIFVSFVLMVLLILSGIVMVVLDAYSVACIIFGTTAVAVLGAFAVGIKVKKNSPQE